MWHAIFPTSTFYKYPTLINLGFKLFSRCSLAGRSTYLFKSPWTPIIRQIHQHLAGDQPQHPPRLNSQHRFCQRLTIYWRKKRREKRIAAVEGGLCHGTRRGMVLWCGLRRSSPSICCHVTSNIITSQASFVNSIPMYVFTLSLVSLFFKYIYRRKIISLICFCLKYDD